jgi:propanediol dehydratase small subunit
VWPDPALLAAARRALPEAAVLAIGTSARVGGTDGVDVEAMEGFAVLRAAELAGVPEETVLELYTALRPRRATAAELAAWAERLERELAAPLTASFVREASHVYELRGLLALDERSPAQV